MAIKAIIFDCFGVLTTDGRLAFCKKYLSSDLELVGQVNELSKLSDAGVISFGKFISEISKMSGISEAEVTAFMNNHVRNDELIGYIGDELKGKYKIGLLSYVIDNFLDVVIGHDGVDLFDEIVLSYQIGVAKPDKLMYETIVKKLGVGYEECLFIDDQPRYCEGAEVLGIKTIVYKNNEEMKQKLDLFLGA